MLIALILYNFDKASFTFAIPDMETSLRSTPFIAGLAAGIFFFGYLTFSIPGTYLTQKRGVKLLLPVWIVGFGVFATLTGYVQNAVELLVIRYLVGFFEGPFAPSITYFISTCSQGSRGISHVALSAWYTNLRHYWVSNTGVAR
uniref:MFS transporter n=1 Tax=Vulcanisaeta sp. JCM 14467 TaxID=1295370 RepID=UPI000A66E1C6|nr:MFS transporter [Vulcanisaeta sp. JCM 14467]